MIRRWQVSDVPAACAAQRPWRHGCYLPGERFCVSCMLCASMRCYCCILHSTTGMCIFHEYISHHCMQLIALAKDQVEKCDDCSIEAELWNSSVSHAKQEVLARELCSEEPSLKLLYTTPGPCTRVSLQRCGQKRLIDASTKLKA